MTRRRWTRARDRAAGCRRHRQALVERALTADLRPGALDRAALDHLARCSTCEAEVGAAIRTRLALARTWHEASVAEPAGDAWPRLKARVERRSVSSPRAASPVLGLVLGAGLSLAMLLPIAAARPDQGTVTEPGINPSTLIQADRRDAAAEAQWLRSTVQAGKEAPLPLVARARTRSDLARYAEGPTTGPLNRVPRAQARSVE